MSSAPIDTTAETAAEREVQALDPVLEERIKARTAKLEAEISARRRLEDELRARNAHLERQLADCATGFHAAYSALRESESRFRAIFNHVSDGILIQDPETGQVIAINDRLVEQFGGRHEEVLAMGFGALLAGTPPYTLADAGRKIQLLLTTGPQSFEWLAHRHDGSTYWVEVSLRLVQINGHTRLLALTCDISSRKDVELALRESEERYRTLFDSVVDAIFVLDLEGNFLAVNDHACQRYGYHREEFLKLHISAIDSPADAIHAPARLAAIMREGQVTFEAQHQDAQGRPLLVEARASRILFNGRPAMLSVVRDLTEQRKAAEPMRYLAFNRSHPPGCLGWHGSLSR